MDEQIINNKYSCDYSPCYDTSSKQQYFFVKCIFGFLFLNIVLHFPNHFFGHIGRVLSKIFGFYPPQGFAIRHASRCSATPAAWPVSKPMLYAITMATIATTKKTIAAIHSKSRFLTAVFSGDGSIKSRPFFEEVLTVTL